MPEITIHSLSEFMKTKQIAIYTITGISAYPAIFPRVNLIK